jgi:hypothetical protein
VLGLGPRFRQIIESFIVPLRELGQELESCVEPREAPLVHDEEALMILGQTS